MASPIFVDIAFMYLVKVVFVILSCSLYGNVIFVVRWFSVGVKCAE